MKLVCTVQANEDGHVTAEFGKTKYIFENENGELVAEVDNAEHVAHLLGTGNFYPHDEGDYQQASNILSQESDDDELDSGFDEPLDDPIDPNAMPLESETPLKPARKSK
jgi:hypothetical protein